MIPGPSPTPPEVLAAGCMPVQDERTARFAEVYLRVLDGLKYVLGTKNDVLLMAGSGTGGMESCIGNLFSPGDHVLVASNGHFGERWSEICRAYGLSVSEVRCKWGGPLDWEQVALTARKEPGIKGALGVHCETSTGTVNDIRRFASIVEPAITVVDAIASAGACDLEVDSWKIDVAVGACQKALMTPPGLAFVSVSERAWSAHRNSRAPRFYSDWSLARSALAAECPRTPWTPPVGLITQLDAALALIKREERCRAIRRHAVLARAARAGLRAIGLAIMSPESDEGSPVTAAYVADGVDADELIMRLWRDHGIQITGGQGPLAGKIIRVGHCGYVDHLDVIGAISAIELSLQELGFERPCGTGVAAAEKVLANAR